MEFYFLIYLCLISTYNPARYLTQGVFLPQYRYLICMLPLAAFYLATGWLYVISHVFHRSVQIRTRIVYVGLGLFAIYVLSTSAIAGFLRTKHEWPLRGRPIWDPVRLEQTDNTANHALAQYMRTAFWIRDNLSTNIVIASRKPEHTYLFSGRKSFRYDGVDVHGSNVWDIMTRQQQYGELIILQDAFPPDTVYGQDRMTMLEPLMREKEHQLELLYESAPPTTRVWRVHSFNQ
jgi:hypothetical protein